MGNKIYGSNHNYFVKVLLYFSVVGVKNLLLSAVTFLAELLPDNFLTASLDSYFISGLFLYNLKGIKPLIAFSVSHFHASQHTLTDLLFKVAFQSNVGKFFLCYFPLNLCLISITISHHSDIKMYLVMITVSRQFIYVCVVN